MKSEIIKEESDVDDEDNMRTELTRVEVELCKQNFQYYDKDRKGYVERFELPMLLNGIHHTQLTYLYLACGYQINDDKIAQLNEYLDNRKATKIDINTILSTLT